MRRATALLSLALTSGLTAHCSRDTTTPSPSAATTPVADASPATPAPSEASLPPVSLPDLSSAATPVQAQLRARYAALTAALGEAGGTATVRARAYGELGHYLLAATFFDEAALCYSHAEALEPGDARWPYLRAHADLRKGDREAAARALERAAALRADLPTLVWLGDTYLDLGRVAQAHAAYSRVLTRQPESAPALFGAGRVALSRGAYADAISYLEHALRVDPRASVVNYPLAMAYRGAGRRTEADALVRKRGTVAPALEDPVLQEAEVLLDSAVSHEAQGMQALRRQDWPGARDAFKRGLVVAPHDSSLRYWMATAMIASGDAAGAEREFRTIVREQPDFAKAHFSLGAVLEQRGQRVEALHEYEAAVRAAPNMPEARLRLADTLRRASQYQEAMVQYRDAVTLDPAVAEGWIGGAASLIALGSKAEARDWIAQGRRLHPARREWTDLDARAR